MIDSVLSAGYQGIQSGLSATRTAAENINKAVASERPDTLNDLTKAAVELKVGERQVQASAEVVKTADEVLGTLLDTRG
ncbi:MAG: hypothetical protein WCY88_14075 [Spongiibacteraceae bacterium]